MYHEETHSWIQKFDAVLDRYNNSPSRPLGGELTPNQAELKKNRAAVARAVTEYRTSLLPKTKMKPRFEVGDTVRSALDRGPFARRSYLPSFDTTPYTIAAVFTNMRVPMYALRDARSGQMMRGRYYEAELGYLAQDPDDWRVERILGKKKIDGKTYYEVEFRGFSGHPKLVAEEDLKPIKK